LLIRELLLDHQGEKIECISKEKKSKLVLRDFIGDARAETPKTLPDVFKSDAFSILAIPIQTYLFIVSMYCNTHFDTAGALFLGFHR